MVRAGEAFTAMGPFGTFLYGLTGRLLNVFGLHHAVYPLFWYTELGGTMEVAGKLIAGGQKIFLLNWQIQLQSTIPPMQREL